MTDIIPEDIQKAAEDVYEACEYGDSGEIIDCIANAIYAERKRWLDILGPMEVARD